MTSIEQVYNDKALLEAISKEAPYIEWFTSLRAPETKRRQPYALVRYMKFYSFTSTYDMIRRDPKMIQADIIQYIITDTSISRNTMQTYVAILRGFYILNDITTINWRKVKSKLGEIERRHQDQAYTPEQIKTILDNGCSELRTKAVILLLASSGMRIGALPSLLMKHLHYHEKEELYRFTVYAGSNKEYTTFCSREASKSINAYLDYRQASGETITPETPLFREQFDPSDNLRIDHPKLLDVDRLKKMVYTVAIRAGIRKVTKGHRIGTIKHEVHSSHGFRKFFDTTLVNCDVNPILLGALMGHNNGLQRNYERTTEKDKLSAYMKAEEKLTIDPANRLQKQVVQLQAQNEIIEGKYQQHYQKIMDLLMSHPDLVSDSLKIKKLQKLDAELLDRKHKELAKQFELQPCSPEMMQGIENSLKTTMHTKKNP